MEVKRLEKEMEIKRLEWKKWNLNARLCKKISFVN